jgi:hypothetical protein
MLSSLRKPVLAAAFMALSPLAAVLPGGASDAQAHTYSRGHVRIGIPLPRINIPLPRVNVSFGSPYIGRRVNYAPGYGAYGPAYGYGAYGPIYYYPQPRFYAPSYPTYGYSPYGWPGTFRRSDRDHHRGGSVSIHGPFGHSVRARWH